MNDRRNSGNRGGGSRDGRGGGGGGGGRDRGGPGDRGGQGGGDCRDDRRAAGPPERGDRGGRGGGGDSREGSWPSEKGPLRESEGKGPNTQWLEMEMSQVLFSGASSWVKDCLRDAIIEEMREHLRDRWGDKIRGLAQIAVDELMNDVESSLDIEARIQERNEEKGRTGERVRTILRGTGRSSEGRGERRDEGGERDRGGGRDEGDDPGDECSR